MRLNSLNVLSFPNHQLKSFVQVMWKLHPSRQTFRLQFNLKCLSHFACLVLRFFVRVASLAMIVVIDVDVKERTVHGHELENYVHVLCWTP